MMGLLQKRKVGLHQFRGPERLEGLAIKTQGLLGGTAAVLEPRPRFHRKDLVLRESFLIIRNKLFGCRELLMCEKEIEEAGIGARLLWVPCYPCTIILMRQCGGESLSAKHRQDALEGAPGTPACNRQELFRRRGGRARHRRQGCHLILWAQAAMVEVRQLQLAGGLVRENLGSPLPIGLSRGEIQLLFFHARPHQQQFRVGRCFRDQVVQGVPRFSGRTADGDGSIGQGFGLKEHGFEAACAFDVLKPFRELTARRVSGSENPHQRQSDEEAAKASLREPLQRTPPRSRYCGRYLQRSR